MSSELNVNSRRDFLRFMGGGITVTGLSLNFGCSSIKKKKANNIASKIKPLNPGVAQDEVTITDGLSFEILITEGDELLPGMNFGTNNDFTQFVKLKNNRYGLWVNHEAFTCVFASNRYRSETPTKAQYLKERKLLGGSFFEIKQDKNGKWVVVKSSPYNNRISGETEIPFANNEQIAGTNIAVGTFANCAGGLTPWNTILTCEENYQHYYGEYDRHAEGSNKVSENRKAILWNRVEAKDPRHYGWVVEYNPETKKAKKLVGLGRFSHECAKTVLTSDGRAVVYSGDDTENECLYKFIADKPNSLDTGELFVASLEQKKWLSLDINKNEKLKKNFKDQNEVLTFCREAAKLVGGTPLARPEDIEIDPLNGHVLIALTNNKSKDDPYGSILKIIEPKNRYESQTFQYDTFLTGGKKSGMCCPDNMAIDSKGNLWVTSDISGDVMNKGVYEGFGNNGLFVIPRSGPDAGKVIQIASAPNDAEFTGPCFSSDEKTLFLSVQHPGELSKKGGPYTSHWPHGGQSKPMSAVISISGPLLEQI